MSDKPAMSPEMLPCPWCHTAKHVGLYPQKAPSKRLFYVFNCHECGLVTRGFETEAAAIEWWNTRATVSRRTDTPEDFPAGAIHNGEVIIERIDGNTGNSLEWEELKKCFRYLADYVQRGRQTVATGWQPIETVPENGLIILWENESRTVHTRKD